MAREYSDITRAMGGCCVFIRASDCPQIGPRSLTTTTLQTNNPATKLPSKLPNTNTKPSPTLKNEILHPHLHPLLHLPRPLPRHHPNRRSALQQRRQPPRPRGLDRRPRRLPIRLPRPQQPEPVRLQRRLLHAVQRRAVPPDRLRLEQFLHLERGWVGEFVREGGSVPECWDGVC
jgi:hypothetical protein